MSLTKIGSIGINTGIQFAGVTTVSTLKVGSGVTVSSDGDIFATGVCTATSFSGSGANLTGIDTDLVSDTSPQLGGNLDVNTKNIVFGDSGGATDDRLTFGASTDLSIFHDGSNSYVRETGTGSLFIEGDSDIYIGKASGGAENGVVVKQDGAVDLYHDNSKKLETTSTGVSITGKLETTTFISVAADNQDLKVGAGDDLKLFHDGTDSFIHGRAGTRYLKIRAAETRMVNEANSEIVARFIEDGAVELYHNGTKKAETTSLGIQSEYFVGVDNAQLRLGDSGDLQLFHDGSESYVKSANASSNLILESAHGVHVKHGGENMARFIQDGAVELYHDNIKRFETQSGGARVYGHLGVNVDPNGTHPMRVDHDQQYLIGIRNTAADTGNYPWLCHKEINSKQAFAIHMNGISGDPFHADQDGAIYLNKETSTANALDDYEYGNWTPTFPNGAGGNQTTGTYMARYTKVGKFVYAFLYMGSMTGSAPNNSTGWNIGGLPFAAEVSGLTHHGTGNITYTASKNYDVWRPLVTTNNRIYFHRVDGSGATLNNSDVNSIGMTHFIIGVTYMTS